jgi:hypothetical protein
MTKAPASRLTVDEANLLLGAVRVDRFPIIASYEARVAQLTPEAMELEQVVLITVPDRDDPTSKLDVWFSFKYDWSPEELEPGHLLSAVRNALHSVVTHEMDECLLVDGARPFDPHAPNAGPQPAMREEVADAEDRPPIKGGRRSRRFSRLTSKPG